MLRMAPVQGGLKRVLIEGLVPSPFSLMGNGAELPQGVVLVKRFV